MREEISAFAAYSKKLQSKKSKDNIGVSNKSRHKFKRKSKSSEENVKNRVKLDTASLKNNFKPSKVSPLHSNKDTDSLFKNNLSDLENFEAKNFLENIKSNTNFKKEKKKLANSTSNGFHITQQEKNKKSRIESEETTDRLKSKNDKNTETKIGMNLQYVGDKISGQKKRNAEENEIPVIKKKEGSKSFVITQKKKQMTKEGILPMKCDTVKMGEEVFSWIINPVSLANFFNDNWEKKPLYIQHNSEDYFKCLCTLDSFKETLDNCDLYFTKNIDVTSYVNGERYTENPAGKATLSMVWDLFNSGRSIRLLNPQSFIPNIRLLNSTLQEFFQCFVGANIYLTPAGTQGFAPHYDDIEAFVLQLEGEKHWRLYNPRNPEEILPRESSRNFHENEIGEPIFETILKPGDLLYFPRGIIHQAKCLPHIHSLHVTISCYQKNSWADLFEKVFPVALQRAITEDVEFRRGLPLGYLNHFGMVNSDLKTQFRKEMISKFNELARKVLEFCPLDAGVDQLATGFIHDALPPSLSDDEKLQGGNRLASRYSLENLKNNIDKNLGIRLIRLSCIRLVSEEDELVLYYSTDNSLVYHENDVFSVEIPFSWAEAIECLIHSYPKYVPMNELPIATRGDKPRKWRHVAEFVYFLHQKGLLLFEVAQ